MKRYGTTILRWAAVAVFSILPLMGWAKDEAPAPEKKAETLEALVPSGYEMTLRLDVRKLLDAPELQDVRDRFLTQKISGPAEQILNMTGINIQKDIDTIVVARLLDEGYKQHNLVLLHGSFDQADLVSRLKSAPQYNALEVEGKTLHGFWSEEDQDMRYAFFGDKGVLVIGKQDGLEQLAKGMAGKQPRLNDNPRYAGLLKKVPANAAFAVVTLLPSMEKEKEPFKKALLRKVDSASLTATVGQRFALDFALQVADSETAGLKRQTLEGLVALGQTVEDKSLLVRLLQAVKVGIQDRVVTAHADYAYDEMNNVLGMLPGLKNAEAK